MISSSDVESAGAWGICKCGLHDDLQKEEIDILSSLSCHGQHQGKSIKEEFQAHAVGIVLSADEAVVFLHFCVAGVVTLRLRLRWHVRDFT